MSMNRPAAEPPPRPVREINGALYPEIRVGAEDVVDKSVMLSGWMYVIDFEHSPTLQKLYKDIRGRLSPTSDEDAIVRTVYEAVSVLFQTRDIPQVDTLLTQLHSAKKQAPVSLEDFAAAGTGNCSHTSLTIGLMLEKLRQELPTITGKFSLDSLEEDSDFASSSVHMWGVWRTEDRRYILDVVGNYLGDEAGHEEAKRTIRWQIERSW